MLPLKTFLNKITTIHRWIFGMVGCKLVSFLTLVNMYGSVFFLVTMSIDRFLAVVMAVRARQLRNYRNAFLCCLFVWVAAVSIASEALVLRDVDEVKNILVCFTFFSNLVKVLHLLN